MSLFIRLIRTAVGIVAIAAGLSVPIGPATVMAAGPPPLVLPKEALHELRQLAIQHNGRHKPFDSFAREMLQQITGSPRWRDQDPVLTVLSITLHPEPWQEEPLLSVPFRPLREAIGLESSTAHVSYNALVSTRKLMRLLPPIVQKQRQDEKLTMLEEETMDAFGRFRALSDLLEQRLELVPPASGTTNASWHPIFEPGSFSPEQQQALTDRWTDATAAIRSGRPEAVVKTVRALSEGLRAANPAAYPAAWRLSLEVWYHHVAPFHAARVMYLIAVLGLLWGLARKTRWSVRAGMAAMMAAAAIHLGGILLRVVLGGRPPVSNFYETMLWLPFVAVALALVFERLYRAGYFGLAASALAAIVLTLADYVPLDSSIAPVVAVLRSNLWLTVHVLTIVASYGALALAAVLAHVYGGLYVARRSAATLEPLGLFLYRTIQVGVVLLAGGIMLGAVWANASWGRYWGWDPKETWALITLLWFLALLHGRMAG